MFFLCGCFTRYILGFNIYISITIPACLYRSQRKTKMYLISMIILDVLLCFEKYQLSRFCRNKFKILVAIKCYSTLFWITYLLFINKTNKSIFWFFDDDLIFESVFEYNVGMENIVKFTPKHEQKTYKEV